MLRPSQSHTTHNQNTWHNLVIQNNNSPLLLRRHVRNLTDRFQGIELPWHEKNIYLDTLTVATGLPDHECTVFFSYFVFCLLEMLCFKSSSSERRRRVVVLVSQGLCVVSGPKCEDNLIYWTHVAQTPRWKHRRVYMDLLNACPQDLRSTCMSLCLFDFQSKLFRFQLKGIFWTSGPWVCVSI